MEAVLRMPLALDIRLQQIWLCLHNGHLQLTQLLITATAQMQVPLRKETQIHGPIVRQLHWNFLGVEIL